MLKIILFALLLVGYKCIEPFKANSIEWLDSFRDDFSTRMPRFGPEDDVIDFTVNREDVLKLAFRPTRTSYFLIGVRQYFQLISIILEFHNNKHPEIHIRFKSDDDDREWTVTSQVFESPQTACDWVRVYARAILLISLNPSFARDLDEQEGELRSRYSAFESEWIKELLLLREPPRRRSDEGSHYYYAGLPLIIVPKVYEKLNKVRGDMIVDSQDH